MAILPGSEINTYSKLYQEYPSNNRTRQPTEQILNHYSSVQYPPF